MGSVGLLELLRSRQAARIRRDYPAADAIREQFLAMGVRLLDRPDGSTGFEAARYTVEAAKAYRALRAEVAGDYATNRAE